MVAMVTRGMPPMTATTGITGTGTTTLEPPNINTYLGFRLVATTGTITRSVTMSKACHDAANIGDRIFLHCFAESDATRTAVTVTFRVTVPTIVDEQGGGSVTWDLLTSAGCQVGVAGGTNVNLVALSSNRAGSGRDAETAISTWTLLKVSGAKWQVYPGIVG